MKRMMALMALTILTACDYAARKDIRSERDDRLYRAAMDDYRAGRMDAAIEGFEKTVRGDPANASARFQLACLQQDLKKDYLSAYFGYREYLLQHPESDRARLAKDRMAICEKEMARILSSRHGFNSAEGVARELASARDEIKQLKDRVAAAEKNLGVSQGRVRALTSERDRIVAAFKSDDASAGESGVSKAVLSEKSILEEEEENGDNHDILAEKKLVEADESEELSAGSSLLPARKPDDPARRDAAASAEKQDEPAKGPARPKTYVVQEGDTLYGIAKRFYGSIRPWKAIRDANKALISADNRLKAGDKLVLP